MRPLTLSADDIEAALPMTSAIEAMKRAFVAFSAEEAIVPLRSRLGLAASGGRALVMPASPPSEALAVKLLPHGPENARRGTPPVHAPGRCRRRAQRLNLGNVVGL
jgi:ornithine cyclodeaminase/alanine dehydrogenase-like protein (mu-crystallin family)